MYTIIEKIELENGEFLKSTPVGYTQDQAVINEINESYDSTLGAFLGENRTKLELGEVLISVFFNVISSVNEARTQVIDSDGLGLNEITNVNQL